MANSDDTAHPQQLLSFVGAAQALSGYKIRELCPSLETDQKVQNLIGMRILHAWDNKDRQGWFEARVHGRNLNARDLARAPKANFSVRYSKSLTVGVKKKKIIPLCHVHHKTLFEIAMGLSTNSGSFPSNSHVSATFSILLSFGEFWNPTNCEKFNADGSLMGRTNLDKSVW